MNGTIEVIYKKPGKAPEIREIVNTLDIFQTLVGGHIETVRLTKSVLLVCNEEGKLLGLEPNIFCRNDVIVGPVILVGDAGEDFGSVKDIELWKMMLEESGMEEEEDGGAYSLEENDEP